MLYQIRYDASVGVTASGWDLHLGMVGMVGMVVVEGLMVSGYSSMSRPVLAWGYGLLLQHGLKSGPRPFAYYTSI